MQPQFKEVDGNIGSGRFLIGQNDPNLSNEEVVVDVTTVVIPEGTYMGKRTRGAQAVAAPAAPAGFVGDGVFAAAPTADAGVDPGNYTIAWIDADTFRVERPDGTQDVPGIGQNGAAYNGSINFTYNSGLTPNAGGDTRTVAVSYAAANGRWRPVHEAIAAGATDGTQIAAGLTYHRLGISTATQKTTMVCRHQVVNGHLLNAGTLDATQKAVAESQLAAQQIIVRY